MKLELSAEARAFREEVRAFLDEALTPDLRAAGAAAVSVFTHPEVSLAWQAILHARGWAAPAWPEEYGGPGWSEIQRHIFAEACAHANAPNLAPMGMKMVGPCIMGFGTPEQKAFYLPRILSGQDYWCQGYSEPGAGSDLAALQLRAETDGEDYVLNGSKIWTTHAQFANRMFCLARTSAEGRPQAGITFLLLEMDSPGISVKPIITLAGEHEVNQVFFDDVRVPIANRLGAENQGWSVAKYLLEFERGGATAPGLQAALRRLRSAAGAEGYPDDPAFRRRLAAMEVDVAAIDMTERRVLSLIAGNGKPGALSSLLKTQSTEAMQAVDALALDAAGPYAAVSPLVGDDGEGRDPRPAWARTATARYLNDRAASIYGGSNEIQRDIIARLLLGL